MSPPSQPPPPTYTEEFIFLFSVLISRMEALISSQLWLPGKLHAGLLSKTLSFLSLCLEDQRYHSAACGLLSIVLWALALSPGFLLGQLWAIKPHHVTSRTRKNVIFTDWLFIC